MSLPKVYLRREPASDPASLAMERAVPGSTRRLTNVAIYKDQECTQPIGRFSPDSTSAPRRSSKTVTLNCAKHAIEWLDALKSNPAADKKRSPALG